MPLMKSMESSIIRGFSRSSVEERIAEVARRTGTDLSFALSGGLTAEGADRFVENAVGVFGMPLGIATHFIVNGQEVPVPMAIEEPSVIAAASNGARMARFGGGFFAETDPSLTAVQIEILDPAPGCRNLKTVSLFCWPGSGRRPPELLTPFCYRLRFENKDR
jgi:hydroxymethylglutaryl-CoA reductase